MRQAVSCRRCSRRPQSSRTGCGALPWRGILHHSQFGSEMDSRATPLLVFPMRRPPQPEWTPLPSKGSRVRTSSPAPQVPPPVQTPHLGLCLAPRIRMAVSSEVNWVDVKASLSGSLRLRSAHPEIEGIHPCREPADDCIVRRSLRRHHCELARAALEEPAAPRSQ